MIKEKKTDALPIWKGLLGLATYFILYELLNINLGSLPTIVKQMYNILIEVIIIVVFILLFKDYLKKAFKDIKDNHKEYFKKYFKYWLLLLGLTFISNFIIILASKLSAGEAIVDIFNGDIPIAQNQEAIIETFKQMPIFIFILSVFLAPVLEEFTFRLSIKSIFKNKYLFISISGVVFGSMHVIPHVISFTNEGLIFSKNIFDYAYIVPYSVPGVIFAWILYKTNNIFIPVAMHFLHNGTLMSIQFLIYITGFLGL